MPMRAPMFPAQRKAEGRGEGQGDPGYEQRRGSARVRGYGPEWDRASRAERAAQPLCVGCRAVGRTVACDVVDHIVPHKGDVVLFWARDNWQNACHWHHDVVKQQLERQVAQGALPVSALRLDSPEAIALTLRLDP